MWKEESPPHHVRSHLGGGEGDPGEGVSIDNDALPSRQFFLHEGSALPPVRGKEEMQGVVVHVDRAFQVAVDHYADRGGPVREALKGGGVARGDEVFDQFASLSCLPAPSTDSTTRRGADQPTHARHEGLVKLESNLSTPSRRMNAPRLVPMVLLRDRRVALSFFV